MPDKLFSPLDFEDIKSSLQQINPPKHRLIKDKVSVLPEGLSKKKYIINKTVSVLILCILISSIVLLVSEMLPEQTYLW